MITQYCRSRSVETNGLNDFLRVYYYYLIWCVGIHSFVLLLVFSIPWFVHVGCGGGGGCYQA